MFRTETIHYKVGKKFITSNEYAKFLFRPRPNACTPTKHRTTSTNVSPSVSPLLRAGSEEFIRRRKALSFKGQIPPLPLASPPSELRTSRADSPHITPKVIPFHAHFTNHPLTSSPHLAIVVPQSLSSSSSASNSSKV